MGGAHSIKGETTTITKTFTNWGSDKQNHDEGGLGKEVIQEKIGRYCTRLMPLVRSCPRMQMENVNKS